MSYIADLHIHSSYARGTSPQLTLENLAAWAEWKGIDLLATGDFTHPAWLAKLHAKLAPGLDGLFSYAGANFLLGTELSCVYQQAGRTRRIHFLVHAPSFEAVERLCAALALYGNLAADGRPTLALSGRDLVELALEADPRCLVMPAHVWTPWYGALGSIGGFESLEECFGDMLPHIPAIETGLSSDPSMNWRVPELDGLSIVSYSDAHSLSRLAREATVFEGEPSYDALVGALREHHIAYTIEFYPEQGKYHFDGHRRCGVCQAPHKTLQSGTRCPVCGRKLTLGVAYRLEARSGREEAVRREDGLLVDPLGHRPPFKRLVQLQEIVAEALGKGVETKTVRAQVRLLVGSLGPELHILQETGQEQLEAVAGERVAEGVLRARHGEVTVEPGFDGVYGTVRIWPQEEVEAP